MKYNNEQNWNSFREEYNEYIPNEDSLESKIKALLSNQLQMWLEDIKKIFNKKLDVYFYIKNDSSINAGVARNQFEYYLYLNLGLIRGIRDFTDYVFLEHVSEENASIFCIQFKDNYVNFFEDKQTQNVELKNTICINILHSVFFHELGHLFLGHLEEDQSFNELRRLNNQSSITRQSLEYIADSFGVNQAFMCSLNCLINAEFPEDYDLFAEATSLFLISEFCLSSILNAQNINVSTNQFQYGELLKLTHPHPAVRFNYLLDIVQDTWINWLQLIKGYNFNQAEQISIKMIKISVDNYFKIVNQYSDPNLTTSIKCGIRKRDVLSIVYDIKMRAAEIHKETAKHAIAPLIDIVPPTEAYKAALLKLARD